MIDPMMLVPIRPHVARLTPMPASPAKPVTQADAETPIVNWQAWLAQEREKYAERMRDLVAQRRAQIIHRVGPLVTPELPPIKVT